ncbi:hypothetical protein HA402_005790 [Bradysia odoriphaga]|nr:hypothetical protein HA402_005790 [Bradysia odoriphaga]
MEGEDYWNKSENKAFSFDEDDRVICSVWFLNAWHQMTNEFPYLKFSQTILHIPTERKIFVDDNTSELNYDFPSSDIPLHLIISDGDLNKVLQEQSMDEPQLPKGIALEEELRILRRKIQERLHAPPASVTVTKMTMKKPYSFDCYRSYREKTELLTEAVSSGNGDAVLAVVLFLVKTLQRKYVVKLLDTHPMALNQLVNYLTVRLQVKECTEWMRYTDSDSGTAEMLQFGVTTTLLKSNSNKTSKLQSVYNDYFNQPGVNTFYAQIVASYVQLLDFQQKEKESNPKAFEILDRPVLETLSYASSQYKWSSTTSDTSANSPHKLSEIFKISQPQFEWIVLNERSRSQAWCDLEGIFEKKTWLNLKSKSFSINVPLDSVIYQLHGLNAPVAILNYFLSKINEPNHRLAVANRVNATKSIVDALSELKDKSGLEKFIETLPVGTDGRFYAENTLKNVVSQTECHATLTMFYRAGVKIL